MPDDNPVEAGQVLGEDGAFQKDWLGLAFPGDEDEAIRANQTLANIGDVRTMAKQVISGESTIGKLSGGRDFAILPNDGSTAEELNEFHTKLGRPEKAEDYGFGNLPEGAPRDEKFIAKMGQVCFGAGISKSAGAKIMAGYQEYYADLTKTMETEDKIGNAEANKQLHTLLGSAYDTKMASANLAIEAIARPIDNEFAETLKKELPYDVMASRMLIKMGEMIGEDKGLKGAVPESGFTPGDARAQAQEIMADPYYGSEHPAGKERNVAKHQELIEKVTRLFEIANA